MPNAKVPKLNPEEELPQMAERKVADFDFHQADNEGDPLYLVKLSELADYCAKGSVYQATGWPCDGNGTVFCEPCLDFYLKWDGCGHYNFRFADDDDDNYIHLCGRADLVRFAEMLPWLFDELAKRIPHWAADVAD